MLIKGTCIFSEELTVKNKKVLILRTMNDESSFLQMSNPLPTKMLLAYISVELNGNILVYTCRESYMRSKKAKYLHLCYMFSLSAYFCWRCKYANVMFVWGFSVLVFYLLY